MATTDRSEEQISDPAPPGEASSPLQPDAALSPTLPPLGEGDPPDTAPAPGDPASPAPPLSAEPPGENGHEPDAPDQASLPGENGHEPDAGQAPLPVRRVRRVLLAQPHLDRPQSEDTAPPAATETGDPPTPEIAAPDAVVAEPAGNGTATEMAAASPLAVDLAAPDSDEPAPGTNGAATAPSPTPEIAASVAGPEPTREATDAPPTNGAIVDEEAPHLFANGAEPVALTADAPPLPATGPDPELLEVLPLAPPDEAEPEESLERRRRFQEALADTPLPRTAPMTETEPAARANPLVAFIHSWFWQSRGFWLGAPATALALFGQKLITTQQAIIPSIRWYGAAIALMILGWLGTYKNKSFLTVPVAQHAARGTLPVRIKAVAAPAPPTGRWAALRQRWPRTRVTALVGRILGADRWRYILTAFALGLNLYAAGQIRADYYSTVGGLGWVFSLLILLFAFVGERPKPHRDADAGQTDVEDRTDVRLPWRIEAVLFLGIVVLTFAMRYYRLDDWTTGMHGDEGEAGMDAINILEGHPVSPFLTGWFSQPNFYYWGIAIFMKLFTPIMGTMGGLRMFSATTGALMVIPLYFLVRLWFGKRAALIAGTFMAISDVAIHFSRQEFSNITTPFFLVVGFLFLFRGLRNMRTLEFVLAGYAFILSMYFYLGGRLSPFLVIAVFGYLFVLMPIVRLPGVYGALRKQMHGLGRWAAWKRAIVTQARGLFHYSRQIVVFVVACICFASPWLVYFLDHQAEWNARSQDKLIFNNPQRMAQQYPQATHDPLYIGIRQPQPTDVWPWMPVVFEPVPNASIKVSDDGFWPRVIWGQLTTTLSILTYRFDASSVYTFTQEPVAKPIEAALIILGIAWALWRWRDSRMAMLTLWFWSTVIVGGVLTIDAPYMARLVGIIPVTAIFAALPLNKLSAEFVQLMSQFGRRVTMARVGQAVSATVLVAILAWLFGQNYSDYYYRYVATWPFAEVTGQAYFVRQESAEIMSEGRPRPKFYDLGMHLIYWGHGDNRFLNHGTDGIDMVNPSNELPILDNGDRDVVFMVWDLNKQYLSEIEAYYPGGEEKPFNYSPGGDRQFLFTSYRVTKEQIDARRVMLATYTPAGGPAIQRQETTLGSNGPPPANLAYPAQATWTGGLMAPAFGRYRFRMDNPGAGGLTIDGQAVLTTTTATSHAEGEVILARGVHDVELRGTLVNAGATTAVQWSVGGQAYAAVPRKVLWGGPGKGLLGTIRAATAGDPLALEPPATNPGGGDPLVLMRRLDGFLGFRDSPTALTNGAAPILAAAWTGTLNITQPGAYGFDVFSNGDSTIYIDGNLVVDNRQGNGSPHQGQGSVTLGAGPHQYDLRYSYSGGTGYLEAYWTPPNGQHVMIGPDVLHADGGVWTPGAIPDPGNMSVQIQLGDDAKTVQPDKIIQAHGDVQQPRGIALDSQGLIYVADTGHHRVAVLDSNGKLVRAIGSQGQDPGQFGDPEDVAIGPDGKLYVLESSPPSRVQVFTTDGKYERTIGANLCSPAGFTVGPDGLIYVANTCGGVVVVYNPDGSIKTQYTGGDDPLKKFDQPVDVAVGKDGMIYVADLRQRVVQMDPTGTIQKSWPVQIGGNLGASNLNLLQDMLYLTNPDRNTVAVIDAASGQSDLFGKTGTDPGQFGEPTGIAGGPDGRLYVMDADAGRIQVFPPVKMPP